MARKEYAVGFIFEELLDAVWLIRKDRPEWQAGKLNGIGGKLEPGETPYEAINREADEEAGYDGQWTQFAEMYYKDAIVICYYSVRRKRDPLPRTRESEKVDVFPVGNMQQDWVDQCVPNLRWLIPAAIEHVRAIPGNEPLILVGKSNYEWGCKPMSTRAYR